MGLTKLPGMTETKLKRIAEMSRERPDCEFKWLMPHFNVESLKACFQELDGRKALGVDGVSKEEYAQNLNKNLEQLIARMRTMSYRPGPVREVLIPKEGKAGATRPLGISNFEDKIVQLMTAKILGAIYEPVFRDCSYGFRPGRSCHQAIKAVRNHIMTTKCTTIIDIDLANYFGTLSHQVFRDLLGQRIKDDTFLRYISRMLKSGVLKRDGLHDTEEGSPQGNVASPVLANIYGHYVIDCWFEEVVKPRCRGTAELFRYCDDVVICCQFRDDAERILRMLTEQLERYGLRLNAEKSHIVPFDRWDWARGKDQGTFDFLGFCFLLGRSAKGHAVVYLKTSRYRLRSKLVKVKEWVRRNRSVRMIDLWRVFCVKLEGHIRYFAVSMNLHSVAKFVHESMWIFFKWMNRRSQRKSMTFEKFQKFMERHPLPKVRVCVSLFPSPSQFR